MNGHRRHRAGGLATALLMPPVLTPAAIAGEQVAIAKRFAIWRQPGTVFGFAEARHLIFDDHGVTNPVAYFVLAVRCS